MAIFGKKKTGENEEKRRIDKKGLAQLIGIYRFVLPYKWTFIAGMFCLLISSSVLLAFPEFTGNLIDASLGNAEGLMSSIDQISLMLIAVLVVQMLFSFLRIYFFAQVSERAMADIRTGLYERYLTLPMAFYDKRRSGELLSRITADVSLLQDTFSVTLAEFFRQTITLFVGIGILFYKTPKLTFFMLGILPILMLAAMFFGKFIRKLSKRTQDEQASANIIVEETLQAISMVKAFTNEIFELKRYGKAQENVVAIALRAATYRGAFVSFIIFVLFGTIVGVLWFGASLVESGEISIGELTSFIIYTMFIAGSIGGLGNVYGQLQKAVGASDRVRDILDETSEQPLAKTLPPVDKNAQGKIEIKNLSFVYPTRTDITVLKNIDMQIAAGQKIALVGHSGAGKSTIAQLMLRFYALNEGSIKVDGKNIWDYDLQVYRQLIGVVPQEVILFGGTIRENIAYGNTKANDEEIRAAAQKANALDFIEGFPEGLDTVVGERGVKLSGGQRQRIAIARAILKDPKILILDEATSSLDAEAESLVQDALDKLMKNRTTIIIAHRLATIQKADRIYVLDKGQVCEQGNHEELIRTNGIYNRLIKLQTLDQAEEQLL
ncbi:MAG: ATP-binding cassette domain-containing protein [Bernardetiaceae bacterium]|nr:ATP-binding cassette domain-containing protein [Bernardetiaceae bacterium]